MRKLDRKEMWASAAVMSVLSEHMKLKARLGTDPRREDVAESLGLKAKSAIQGHLNKLLEGGLIIKKRRGVIELTDFGRVMLDRYDTRGSVA